MTRGSGKSLREFVALPLWIGALWSMFGAAGALIYQAVAWITNNEVPTVSLKTVSPHVGVTAPSKLNWLGAILDLHLSIVFVLAGTVALWVGLLILAPEILTAPVTRFWRAQRVGGEERSAYWKQTRHRLARTAGGPLVAVAAGGVFYWVIYTAFKPVAPWEWGLLFVFSLVAYPGNTSLMSDSSHHIARRIELTAACGLILVIVAMVARRMTA